MLVIYLEVILMIQTFILVTINIIDNRFNTLWLVEIATDSDNNAMPKLLRTKL